MDLENRKLLHGAEYAENFECAQSRNRIALLKKMIFLQDSKMVVDVGCGSALWVDACYPFKYRYMGVDFSESFIEIARKKHGAKVGVEFYCGSVHEYFHDNPASADAVLLLDVSEHVPDEEWLAVLVAIRGGLTARGKVFLHTPNLDYFLERMKQSNCIIKQFPEHVAVRDLQGNVALLLEAGFSIECAMYLPHYNFLRYFHFLSKLPFLGKFFAARIFLVGSF